MGVPTAIDRLYRIANLCSASPMTRIARVVVPGLPHHVTQRGNRRERVRCFATLVLPHGPRFLEKYALVQYVR